MRSGAIKHTASNGFTLIELITVMIILGILTAIVMPKYFSMSEQAELESGNQALAEGVVHFNLAYMKYVVENHTPPENLARMSGSDYLGLDLNSYVVVGSYRYMYTATSTEVTVKGDRKNKDGSWEAIEDESGATASRIFDWP